MSEHFNIGKIVAVFGLQGEVILVHKTGRDNTLQNIPVLFIEDKKNSFLPYFIESFRPKNDQELYLKLEDVNSREAATRLLQKGVYLEEKYFQQAVTEESILFYLGFVVEDVKTGILGNVAEVLEMPSQILLKIYQNGHELLIPLNDNTLKKIDRKRKVIHVSLPEGLLDIYRN